jgi:hypothetical protein
MYVSVAEYDAREAAATARLSYPAVRAFRPAAFSAANFPTRVGAEGELVRYCDIMNELEDAERYYRTASYSKTEAGLMRRTCEVVENLTAELFDRPTQPFMCLFPPLEVLRTVAAIAPEDASILEIGPGSGMLGSYLVQLGYSYRAVDNTQALYLWQSRLFSALAHNDFVDYATALKLPPNVTSRVAQIPWWHFAEAYKAPFKADVIICDGALGEMETFAVYYIIRMAAAIAVECPHVAFLYRSVGEPRITSQATIEQIFALAGFQRQQCGSVTIHTLNPISLPETPPPLGNSSPLMRADQFLSLNDAKVLDSYSFFDFMKLGSALSTLRRQ